MFFLTNRGKFNTTISGVKMTSLKIPFFWTDEAVQPTVEHWITWKTRLHDFFIYFQFWILKFGLRVKVDSIFSTNLPSWKRADDIHGFPFTPVFLGAFLNTTYTISFVICLHKRFSVDTKCKSLRSPTSFWNSQHSTLSYFCLIMRSCAQTMRKIKCVLKPLCSSFA